MPSTPLPVLPDPESITLADAQANAWSVVAHCADCKALRAFSGKVRQDLMRVPIGQLWRERKLVCSAHRTPFAGIEVGGDGNMLLGRPAIGRWYLPGCWPDPDEDEHLEAQRREHLNRLRDRR